MCAQEKRREAVACIERVLSESLSNWRISQTRTEPTQMIVDLTDDEHQASLCLPDVWLADAQVLSHRIGNHLAKLVDEHTVPRFVTRRAG